MKGSVATLSGLVQLLSGAEKAELPHEETEESENELQIDSERWKAGRLLSRLSLIRAHSCTGLEFGVKSSILGAGVFGVASRWNIRIGASKPLDDAIGRNSGLDDSGAASDISIVGIAVSSSDSVGASSGGTRGARLLLSLNG